MSNKKYSRTVHGQNYNNGGKPACGSVESVINEYNKIKQVKKKSKKRK